MKLLRSLPPVLFVLFMTASVRATDWPQFRGPFFNGSTDEKNLPTKWSTTENIAWTAKLPGPSAATPIVSGDHVFIPAADVEADTLIALCFDRKTGKRLWQHDIAKGIARRHRSNFASPSPAADGERVYFFYGNGELIAYDLAGKQVWRRNIQKDYGDFAFNWTFSTSPLLYDGKLYLQVLQRRKNDSFLLAMDPKTGKTLWRHIRPTKARAESMEAFTTPVPFEHDNRKCILIIGGDALTAHAAADGKELWRWGTWNPTRIRHWRHVPSPVASEDIVLVCAPKKDPVYAIKAGGRGQLGDDAVAWISNDVSVRQISSDVPTPAFYDGDFFVLSDLSKALSRVEPKTGKVKWTLRTPGLAKYEASPLLADGKIYLINFQAEVVIVSAKDGNVLNQIPMQRVGEYPIRSTIAAAHGQLFIRTNDKLYCVGKK